MLKNKRSGIEVNMHSCSDLYPYVLYNVGGATAARVVGQADGTHVWLERGNEQTLLTTLAENDVFDFATQEADCLCSNQPIWASGEEGAADIIFQPKWSSSEEVAGTMSRAGGVDITILSLGATSAEVYRNAALQTTIPLVRGEVATFTRTGNYQGGWRVVANGQIISFKRDDNNGNTDSSPMSEPSDAIVGYASTQGWISGNANNTTFTSSPNAGSDYTGSTGGTYNLVNTIDLGTPGGGASDNYYDPRVAIQTTSANLIFGNSRGDSDGGNDTNHFPVSWMRTHHRIPQPTEFISFLNLGGGDVDVFDENNNLVSTITPTRTNGSANAPYAARIGTPNGAVNQPAGYYLIGSEPIYVVYQPKGAGGFGSDDDESVSYGWNL